MVATPKVSNPEIDKAQGTPQVGPSKANNPDTGALFAVVFMLCLEAVSARQGVVLTQSKRLECNVSAQNKENRRLGHIPFSQVPDGAKTATINRVQDNNEHYSQVRQDIQNNLITLRQSSQVLMTQTSTNVNVLEQDASMLSYEIKCQNNIVMALNQMTQR